MAGPPRNPIRPSCVTCRWGIVARGPRLDDERTYCRQIGGESPKSPSFPVRSCTGYTDRRQPSLWEMEEMAWVLKTNPSRHRMGFVQARKLSDDERHVLQD